MTESSTISSRDMKMMAMVANNFWSLYMVNMMMVEVANVIIMIKFTYLKFLKVEIVVNSLRYYPILEN
jgi:hypothetical protein